MTDGSISARYIEAARSFIDLARTLTDAEWLTVVPCTPSWTCRDVLSHVSGIPDDAAAGRLEGVTSEPWTASQVERNAAFGVGELLDRWELQLEAFAAVIDAMGELRPIYDCHTHEHDVRHAIGRPGARDSVVVDDGARWLLGYLAPASARVVVHLDDGTAVSTGGTADTGVVEVSTTRFEVFRSMFGRRSFDQARSLAWSGPPDAIDDALSHWFVFGPSPTPITE